MSTSPPSPAGGVSRLRSDPRPPAAMPGVSATGRYEMIRCPSISLTTHSPEFRSEVKMWPL